MRHTAAIESAAGDHRQLLPHVRHPITQRRCRPHRSRRRIVQLVRQPGRQRTQRQQAFSLFDDLLGVLIAEEQSLEQMQRHREPLPHDGREALGVEHEEPGAFGHPHRTLVRLRHPITQVRLPRTRVHPALRGAIDHQILPARQLREHHGSVHQNVEARRRITLRVHRPRLDRFDTPVSTELRQLCVGELLEQEQRPQFLRITRGATLRLLGHGFARYLCTSITAIAPSPTADATRLAESDRTSPAANTPGTLVSR